MTLRADDHSKAQELRSVFLRLVFESFNQYRLKCTGDLRRSRGRSARSLRSDHHPTSHLIQRKRIFCSLWVLPCLFTSFRQVNYHYNVSSWICVVGFFACCEPEYGFMYYLKGAAAGGICCSITHGALTPVDVVKTRVQLDPAKVC